MLCGMILRELIHSALWTIKKKLLISSLVIGRAVSLHEDYVNMLNIIWLKQEQGASCDDNLMRWASN